MSLAITSKPGDTRLTRWKRILTKYQLINNGASENDPKAADTLRVTIEKVLKCIRRGSTTVDTPVTPTGLDIADSSTTSAIALSWNQTSIPTFNEVHRSANGGAFSLLTILSGSTTIYTDTNVIPSNTYWTYKVRGVTGSTNGDFSTTVSIGNALSFPTDATISFLDLVVVLGQFGFNLNPNVTSVNCPVLRIIGTHLTGSDATALVFFSMPVLHTIKGRITISNTPLTSFSLPALVTLGSLPIFDLIDINSNILLTSIGFPSVVLPNGTKIFSLSSNALDATSIDAFLHRGVVSGTTNDTYSLDGGTNSAPSTPCPGGDCGTLTTAGNTVHTN